MHSWKIAILATVFAATIFAAGAEQPQVALYFRTAQDARQHCPNDVVVWLNIPTRIYHMPGTRWFGATRSGTFVCEREADAEGDRPARNGQ